MLSADIYPVLCNKNLKKKDLVKFLTAVVRFLLCYQIYFSQMIKSGKLKPMPHYLSNQVNFLKRVYEAEQ